MSNLKIEFDPDLHLTYSSFALKFNSTPLHTVRNNTVSRYDVGLLLGDDEDGMTKCFLDFINSAIFVLLAKKANASKFVA